MALIQCSFMSTSLMRTVPIQVVLPTDKMTFGAPKTEQKPFKTLYLLHGIFGSYIDWVTGTRIEQWATAKDLAVVMPSGDNHFYVDGVPADAKYGKFISQELVELTRKSFPLSHRREDTFIGGLSMGGYGSIINALNAPETFGAVCALSSALITDGLTQYTENTDMIFTDRAYYEAAFGKLEAVKGSNKDYHEMARRVAASGAEKPRFFMSCGTEDGLFGVNEAFMHELKELGYDVTWLPAPGVHDWLFWDTHIKDALDWLPLGEESQGISSGHVSE